MVRNFLFKLGLAGTVLGGVPWVLLSLYVTGMVNRNEEPWVTLDKALTSLDTMMFEGNLMVLSLIALIAGVALVWIGHTSSDRVIIIEG